jgi:hypothetical protein
MTPAPHQEPYPVTSDAGSIASKLLDRADRDAAFVLCLMGESQHVLARHFLVFIEMQLRNQGVDDKSHPLLRPFIEIHARELTDFVLKGVGLKHQFGLQSIENLRGDPFRLVRVDLWDTLRTHIEEAERHFVSGIGGLQRILAEIHQLPPAPGDRP